MGKQTSKQEKQQSLSEVHDSVVVNSKSVWWRQWLAITGPGFMAALGYMDPGNWATDIAGGSRGHSGVSDLIHGTVISNLRHQIQASLIIIPLRD